MLQDQALIRQVQAYSASDRSADQTEDTENLQGAGGIAEQKFYSQKIEEDSYKTKDIIFGFSELPFSVIDFDLCDRYSHVTGNCRDEAVHLTVKVNVFYDISPKGFKSTTVIVQFNPGYCRDKPVSQN